MATAGCGGGGSTPQSAPLARPSSGATSSAPGKTTTQATGSTADPYSEGAGGQESALRSAVHAYITAIDRRDGRRLCALFVPGALASVHLPGSGSCTPAVATSIGHVEPGGPRWRMVEIARIRKVELDPRAPNEARVLATTVTRFEAGREPSIEDDLIYLRRVGGRWLIAQPSVAFYRAIGARTPPLRAIVPPAPGRVKH